MPLTIGSCFGSVIEPVSAKVDNIDYVLLTNAIYDDLYATSNITKRDFGEVPPAGWDFDTIMHAQFAGNLHAGNVTYHAQEVEFMRVKRRKKTDENGVYGWVTMFEVPINDAKDFKFERFDRFARSEQDYDYAIVPVIHKTEGGNVEGDNMFQGDIEGGVNLEDNLYVSSVRSEFERAFLFEKEEGFWTAFEMSYQLNKNHPTVMVVPINRRYPYVFGNGDSNYYTGSFSAIWLLLDENCNFILDEGWKHRDALMEFLCNGKPKMLKMPDGRMWLVGIIETPTESVALHESTPTTSFQWAELANCESGRAMYEHGLIDASSNAE